MTESIALSPLDWAVIGAYLVFALGVGLSVRGKAGGAKESYFLADRGLPWWWAGASIAATTFAADTPLAVTGIIASKGISGNWIWLSWIGVHAAVVVFFAASWSRSGVLTDAELVSLRYSGRSASWLRSLRAGLFGVIYNCIILGWVLRAMVKIATPFFHWEVWTPSVVAALSAVWPEGSSLGSPAEGLTVVLLLMVVATYSSLGGIRGVILTDLFQLAMAMGGSIWLAVEAWNAVGGREPLVRGLSTLYGADHTYLDLFPTPGEGWLGAASVGAFAFGAYLVVQSYANVPADGGGYLMQRLNTTKSPKDARKAAMFFVILQYVVRVWPWLIVGTAALVLIPLGAETEALGGAGAVVAGDRELAYPVLMAYLLRPGVLGVMVMSLLAAFMSTVDTHINWGASYVVNDVYLRLFPDAPPARQIRAARLSVLGFVLLAVLVSFQIATIEQAWKWVATLGAALGVPTMLRWVWWRVNAASELWAMAFGLATAAFLGLSASVPYELSIVLVSAASALGMGIGIAFGAKTEGATIARFVAKVRPHGFWPGRRVQVGAAELGGKALGWAAVVAGVVASLFAIHRVIFWGEALLGAAAGVIAFGLFAWGARRGRGSGGEDRVGESNGLAAESESLATETERR